MNHDTTLNNALWQFATGIYAQANVANTLLWLQNAHGLNINIVILMMWLDQQGFEINPVQLNECIRAIADLEQELIQPLRQIRKHIKTLIPDEKTVYEHTKQLELALEQLAIARLYSHASQFLCNTQETFSPHHNLSLYVLSSGQITIDELQALWPLDR